MHSICGVGCWPIFTIGRRRVWGSAEEKLMYSEARVSDEWLLMEYISALLLGVPSVLMPERSRGTGAEADAECGPGLASETAGMASGLW